MTAPLAWMDVVSTDLPRSVSFYEEVFGWELRAEVDEGHLYDAFIAGDDLVAGAEAIPEAKGPPRWTVYVATDDMTLLVESVLAAGGALTFDPTPLAEAGTVAMITDPFAATVGVWQPHEFDPRTVGPVEGRLAGAELATAAVEDTVDFLSTVLGWTVVTAEPGEVGLDAGGLPVRVVLGAQGQWRPILRVASQAATVAAIESYGGVVGEARPDGLRLAADPFGAEFLVAP